MVTLLAKGSFEFSGDRRDKKAFGTVSQSLLYLQNMKYVVTYD